MESPGAIIPPLQCLNPTARALLGHKTYIAPQNWSITLILQPELCQFYLFQPTGNFHQNHKFCKFDDEISAASVTKGARKLQNEYDVYKLHLYIIWIHLEHLKILCQKS